VENYSEEVPATEDSRMDLLKTFANVLLFEAIQMKERVILLAEDDLGDVEAMQAAFAQLGVKHPLQIVRDGEEVVSYLSGEGKYADRGRFPSPSMLILDLKMPKKTGWEVLEWLRTSPRPEDLFVVVMTSCEQTEQKHQTFEFHGNVCVFSCYLLKPVTLENVDMLIHFFESWLVSRK
jgi:CheY-like chemotaxis protein